MTFPHPHRMLWDYPLRRHVKDRLRKLRYSKLFYRKSRLQAVSLLLENPWRKISKILEERVARASGEAARRARGTRSFAARARECLLCCLRSSREFSGKRETAHSLQKKKKCRCFVNSALGYTKLVFKQSAEITDKSWETNKLNSTEQVKKPNWQKADSQGVELVVTENNSSNRITTPTP